MSLVRHVIQRCGAMREVGLARVQRGQRAILLASVVLGLAGGCSLALNTDRQQCDAPTDCALILGGEATAYTCEQHLCQAVVECRSNPDCVNKGSRAICGEGGLCVECVTDPDCGSPTAHCVASVCEDPTWGCLDKPDSRAPATLPAATLTAKALDALESKPLVGLTARACNDSIVDAPCTQPYAGTTTNYDTSTGELTVTGLKVGLPIRLKLEPDASLGMFPLQYYTNRSARDIETISDLKLVPKEVLSGFAMSLMPIPGDLTKANLSVEIHDCQGVPAAGVKLSMLNAPADLITAYISDIGAPRFDLTETTVKGTAGLLNVPPMAQTTLVVTISPTKSMTFQFVPLGATSSIVDLYPGIFGK